LVSLTLDDPSSIRSGACSSSFYVWARVGSSPLIPSQLKVNVAYHSDVTSQQNSDFDNILGGGSDAKFALTFASTGAFDPQLVLFSLTANKY
jgi:hypothetical protein